jgi:hypothetical protein
MKVKPFPDELPSFVTSTVVKEVESRTVIKFDTQV